ncbi:MAG: 5,6-dimethylbenzimidazole synthase [Hyphomicrobiales bacterium]|uniref:5,6-dimethylbenzimidazole synthase n=1 Tax=Rhabdaerophilum calidifontis TaxID=2604328 RepID=UPI00140CE9C3|nr:5,6-dimethylbenzimidazole synthase [Rhabdaerophilum calidifontis]MCA1951737.1 5,6-dimethylbenzimidazole synthase [Hyphomicrobiales bacterium]MCA1998360.1 5,6-dimethylbenzimidazole synthase [Hyphomicrobiales bacterium]
MTRFTAADADILREILRWRRDIRHFRPDPLPESLMERLRAAMDLAPSVGNSRPWRVLRVRSPEKRAEMRAIFARENAEAARAYAGERAECYARLKLEGLDCAPEQLAVFTDLDPEAGHGLGRRTMPETLAQSTAMAIQVLWLAARAENIGLGMVSILDPRAVEALFAVPARWRFTAYLCLGRPALADDDLPLIHRCGWQENSPTPWSEA